MPNAIALPRSGGGGSAPKNDKPDEESPLADLASERAERICVERYVNETGGRARHGAPVVSPYDTHRSERQVTIHGTIGNLNATATCKVEDGEITEFILLE